MSDDANHATKPYWEDLYVRPGASLLDNDPIEADQRELRLRAFTNAVKDIKNPTILEAGFGTGKDLVEVARRTGAQRACGIDFSTTAVDVARKTYADCAGVEFECADILALPFAAGTFDLTYNSGVIEHFADSKAPLKEMRRVTKPGGKIVVFVPNRWSLWCAAKVSMNTLHRVTKRVRPWPVWEKSFTAAGLARLGREAGLSDVSVHGIHLLHYTYGYMIPERATGRRLLPSGLKRRIESRLRLWDAGRPSLSRTFGMECYLIGTNPA